MDPELASAKASLVETLFSRAASLDPAERARFLDETCGSDTALRSELESLLARDTNNDQFLKSAIANAAVQMIEASQTTADRAMQGRIIGPYRLLELIGRGGMGAVYRAVRVDQFQMQVALKLMKRGTDTDLAIRQFRKERQILAQLNHPNIARLLDGGTTDDGLPYFVMEFVEGQRITDYCQAAKLEIADRLMLFRSVCAAVQHAHQHLVTHRDLKPSNILVTAEGIAKLLDFGVAKILEPDQSEQLSLSLTSAGLRMMTPDYASPEQVAGLPLTTASDIYSLGVVLYELLTGERPHHIKTPSPSAIEQAICHEEPRAPASICKQIDRDLSTIVLTSLRKEPARRYSSVEKLSDDIRRYLEGRPILARKATLPYRCRKFIQRHTLASVTGAVIAAGLVMGAVAVHTQAVRAERRFQQVRKLANTMMFDLHDEIAALPGATKPRQLLVKTALEYLDSLAAEAAGDRQLELELATAYERVGDVQGSAANSHLGHPEAAVESYRKGLAIAEKLPPNLQSLELLSRLYYKVGDVEHRLLGRPAEGREDILRASRIADSIPEKTGAAAFKERAEAAGFLGELDILRNPGNAVAPLEKSLAIARQWAAPQSNSESALFQVVATTRVAEAIWQTGRFRESLNLHREAISVMEELVREQPDNVAWQHQMALCYQYAGMVAGHPQYINLGDSAAAATWFEKMAAIFERLSAADPKDMRAQFSLSEALASLAAALRDSNPLRAEQLYRRSLALNMSIVQANPDDALAPRWQAFNRVGLAWILGHHGRRAEALRELEKARILQEWALAKEPADAQFQEELAVILCALGTERGRGDDRAEADARLHRGLTILLPLWQENPRKLTLLRDLADCYEQLGNLAASQSEWSNARSWYAKSMDLWNAWPKIAISSEYDLAQNRRIARLLSQLPLEPRLGKPQVAQNRVR